jgi:diguanylate cyclase (GGDEF)-like protein
MRRPARALTRVLRRALNPSVYLGVPLIALAGLGAYAGAFRLGLAASGRVLLAAAAGLAVLAAVLLGLRHADRLARAERTIRQSEALARRRARELQVTLDHMGQGLVMVDGDGMVAVINRRCLELLGLPADLAGRRLGYDTLARALPERAGERGAGPARLPRAASRFERQRPDGTVLEVHTVPLPDGGFVRTVSDVTQRRQSAAEVARLACRDGLTGLVNRAEFRARLEAAVASGEGFALHLVDLDRFKGVNDALGHPGGDRVMQIAAARLRQAVRGEDLVARHGGDEFAILERDVREPAAALALGRRIAQVLAEPYALAAGEARLGASVGVAIAPDHGQGADELLRAAHLALEGAKAEGRGEARLFEPQMTARAAGRRHLEQALAAALARNELEVFYQAVHALGSGAVTGYEALLRWRHPERGLVPPLEFIPLAEDLRLIVPIGAFVVAQACRDVARLPGEFRVSVNLSPVQLEEGALVATVERALAESGLAPGRLALEITETTLLRRDPAILRQLHALRGLGVRISMDDFGTGYSSLSYLLSFPFDRIKIDRTFVADLPASESARAIVKAIVDLARSLGVATTAEGVETQAQAEALVALGCEEAQGYLYARPLPAAEAFGDPARRPGNAAA